LPTTPIYGLPYPDPSDIVRDHPADHQALAGAVEGALSSRLPSMYNLGQTYGGAINPGAPVVVFGPVTIPARSSPSTHRAAGTVFLGLPGEDAGATLRQEWRVLHGGQGVQAFAQGDRAGAWAEAPGGRVIHYGRSTSLALCGVVTVSAGVALEWRVTCEALVASMTVYSDPYTNRAWVDVLAALPVGKADAGPLPA
jgi:hypothetical protein